MAKKKAGARFPCGKLKQPTKDEREIFQKRMEEIEMQTALAQPHRRGDRDQRCATALGRFFKINPKLRRELYDAAEEYASLKRRWRSAKGVPNDVRLGVGGNGIGPSDATVRAWEGQIKAVDVAISDAAPLAAIQFIHLVLDDKDLDPKHTSGVIVALHACASALGFITSKMNPYN